MFYSSTSLPRHRPDRMIGTKGSCVRCGPYPGQSHSTSKLSKCKSVTKRLNGRKLFFFSFVLEAAVERISIFFPIKNRYIIAREWAPDNCSWSQRDEIKPYWWIAEGSLGIVALGIVHDVTHCFNPEKTRNKLLPRNYSPLDHPLHLTR